MLYYLHSTNEKIDVEEIFQDRSPKRCLAVAAEQMNEGKTDTVRQFGLQSIPVVLKLLSS